MQLSKNDMKLIKYLFECKFLTRKQIKKYVLANMNNSYIDDRLPQLRKNNYIKYVDNPINFINEKYLYVADFLAEQNLIADENNEKLKQICNDNNLLYVNPSVYKLNKEIDLRNLIKNYYLNEVRFKFENIGAKNWLPKYIIRNVSRRNLARENGKKIYKIYPDAIIRDKYNIAIELVDKSKAIIRYKEKFKKYDDENFDFILYITFGNSSGYLYNSLQNKFNPVFMENDITSDNINDDFYNKFFAIKYKDIKNKNYKIYNKEMKKSYYLPEIF